MAFRPGVPGGEAPVDDRCGLVALPFRDSDVFAEDFFVGVPPSEQRRDMALNSIPAIFSRPSCLGVGRTPASGPCAGNGSYNGALRRVFGLSKTTRITPASG